MSFRETALAKGMQYTVSDVPNPFVGILLGFQHFLTMLGATALIPILIVPAMGGTATDTAEVISTIFFVSGLNTLLQTTFGDRLPIIQGGSFAFLTPTFGIIFHPELISIADPAERFRTTICTVQGAVLITGIVQVVMGYCGFFAWFLRFVSPVSIAPTVAMVGLGLFGAMNGNMIGGEWLWAITVCSVITFGYLLNKIAVPLPGGGKLPIFGLFPVIWAIALAWLIAGIAEAAGAFDPIMDTDGITQLFAGWPKCRTKTAVIGDSLGAKFPYPGQWGAPIFKGYAIGPMIGAMMVSMVESIGDYYACAKLAGAPPPSGSVISRGLASEGWGLMLCGLFGTGNGTTSYGENIGAISVTKVGSRAVAQAGACIMIIVGLFPKFGAIFVAMPDPIIAGMYSCMFGLIAASGLSLLDRCDLQSSRNLFILGFCLYNGLALAAGAGSYFANVPHNPFGADDQFFKTFFNNTMIISLLSGFILDNIIPGEREERGCWEIGGTVADPEFQSVYGLPWCLAKVFKNCVYLDFLENGFKWPETPEGGHMSSSGDCCEMLCPCIPFFKGKEQPSPAITKGGSGTEVSVA